MEKPKREKRDLGSPTEQAANLDFQIQSYENILASLSARHKKIQTLYDALYAKGEATAELAAERGDIENRLEILIETLESLRKHRAALENRILKQ